MYIYMIWNQYFRPLFSNELTRSCLLFVMSLFNLMFLFVQMEKYINILSTDSHVECVSLTVCLLVKAVDTLRTLSFTILVILLKTLFLKRFAGNWFLRSYTYSSILSYGAGILIVLFLILSVFGMVFVRSFAQTGLILRPDGSNIMYQYEYNDNDGLQAYPILSNMNFADPAWPSVGCTFLNISKACSTQGPLLEANLDGVFKCRSNSDEGLEFFLSHFRTLLRHHEFVSSISYLLIVLFPGISILFHLYPPINNR